MYDTWPQLFSDPGRKRGKSLILHNLGPELNNSPEHDVFLQSILQSICHFSPIDSPIDLCHFSNRFSNQFVTFLQLILQLICAISPIDSPINLSFFSN